MEPPVCCSGGHASLRYARTTPRSPRGPRPFFFRLKSPHNAIAGFGYFASYSALPAWLAWGSFGRTNGAADFDEMRARIERYRRRSGAAASCSEATSTACSTWAT